LQIDGGYFRKMVDETGFQSAKILEKIAREVNIPPHSFCMCYYIMCLCFLLHLKNNVIFSRNVRPIPALMQNDGHTNQAPVELLCAYVNIDLTGKFLSMSECKYY
jgi:hypothetical protein